MPKQNSTRMDWVVRPGQGSSVLFIGQKPSEIKTLLGNPDSITAKFKHHYYYIYYKLGLQIDRATTAQLTSGYLVARECSCKSRIEPMWIGVSKRISNLVPSLGVGKQFKKTVTSLPNNKCLNSCFFLRREW